MISPGIQQVIGVGSQCQSSEGKTEFARQTQCLPVMKMSHLVMSYRIRDGSLLLPAPSPRPPTFTFIIKIYSWSSRNVVS